MTLSPWYSKSTLADFNETYTHYRRGYVELTYQFSCEFKFL